MPTLAEVPAPTSASPDEPQVRIPVSIAYGDGIGPEIMQATLRILDAAGAPLQYEPIELGQTVYLRGVTAGIEDAAWQSIRSNRVLLKAPITTPQGSGYKSLNVTLRKALGLYSNIRPAVAYAPFVRTSYPQMDVVIVRENEEDLYGGIEHQQTDQVVQCLKLVTRPGCQRIIRYAFEYARRNGRRKVTCMTKDNIMKKTDGLFHKVFEEIAAEYPDIASDHLIIDIGAARMADTPEMFDVIVTLNLYGDILSDIAAQVAGSVGLAPSANIGSSAAMFEAIHGSAPQIAGQDIANPSGLLLSAIMMLVHLGQTSYAETVHNAWLRTIEDGIHTADIYREGMSRKCVGTEAFTGAVIERLGLQPHTLPAARYSPTETFSTSEAELSSPSVATNKQLVGVDVFLDWRGTDPNSLGNALRTAGTSRLPITMITNRGAKVWPDGLPETFCTDHWRCRFQAPDGTPASQQDVLDLLNSVHQHGFECIKTENLYTFDGQPGYSLGQGQ